MPVFLTCPQGHQWQLPNGDAARPAGSKALCPVCGAAVAPVPRNPLQAGNSRAETLPPGPQALPAGVQAAVEGAAGLPTVPGYEVLGELGRGGMGVVYKARQLHADRLVALKTLRNADLAEAQELARFRTEAQAVARLQHPNIVQVHEVGEAGGRPFFSLEFCPGGSLADRLRGTPLPPRDAARLVETLARAADAAHQAGIIHRDLTPGNVLFAADGGPKLTDFGLAKQLGEGTVRTASGVILGTPSYMAPEQAGGKSRAIGPSADVYALGPSSTSASPAARPSGRQRPWTRSSRSSAASRCRRRSSSPAYRATWRPCASSAWARTRPGATPRPPTWPATCAGSSMESRFGPGR
jgi:serine/threonine protein kinase